MPTIEVSDGTFAGLQRHARPFVDTPDLVIAKLIGFKDQAENGSQSKVDGAQADETTELNPLAPPSLRHTKFIAGSYNGVPVRAWNELLMQAVLAASDRLKTFEGISKVCSANIVKGKREEAGFKYLPAADLSLQGTDANSAWKAVARIARQLKQPVEAEFMWRHEDGAERPGEFGKLVLRSEA